MARLWIDIFMNSLLITVATVLGCGVMPPGQASSRTFTVSGFTLPVAMVYSTASNIQARFPGVAPNKEAARGFVERLVMQTVFDVLERQGRSALLPDVVISAILGQLSIRISYDPLNCQMSVKPEDMHSHFLADNAKVEQSCIIVGNTVTGICGIVDGGRRTCMKAEVKEVTISSVNSKYLTIAGTLSTTNIIMSNWSRAMWQNVVNRAVRLLALRPFESHFLSASVTVDGN
ncbi:hypothetical protein KIN20_003998 [Parelaphostrongylus tenuis]|uniref:Uncharacterized protein n=1 Tax=Parelaphostrongylus tenuis TaxID=148309 RepID=A0AAD5M2E2_PARTN|nr:hypothetical protein KIN20_003998 [Parelaphostrongylus tenuis]